MMIELIPHIATVIATRFGIRELRTFLESHELLPGSVYHSRTVEALKKGDLTAAISNLKITLEKNPEHAGGQIYLNILETNLRKKHAQTEEKLTALSREIDDVDRTQQRIIRKKQRLFWLGYAGLIIQLLVLVLSALILNWYWAGSVLGLCLALDIFLYRHLKSRFVNLNASQDYFDQKLELAQKRADHVKQDLTIIRELLDTLHAAT